MLAKTIKGSESIVEMLEAKIFENAKKETRITMWHYLFKLEQLDEKAYNIMLCKLPSSVLTNSSFEFFFKEKTEDLQIGHIVDPLYKKSHKLNEKTNKLIGIDALMKKGEVTLFEICESFAIPQDSIKNGKRAALKKIPHRIIKHQNITHILFKESDIDLVKEVLTGIKTKTPDPLPLRSPDGQRRLISAWGPEQLLGRDPSARVQSGHIQFFD